MSGRMAPAAAAAGSRVRVGPFGRIAGVGAWTGIVTAACMGLLAASAVAADPASSADSAWAPLPSARAELPSDPLERRGQEVFDQRCAACHGEIPEDVFGPTFLPAMPGTEALAARYGDALPAVLEERADLAPEYIEAVVRDGLRSMPFFRPTEVSDEDLQALVAWLTRDRDAAGE